MTRTHGCLCKIIFSAIFAIATTIPTFATNISDSNKGCTSGNLTTSSGAAALEADWAANTVTVTYYNGDSQFNTGQCTYDGTLTLPSTDPTKTGYTFAGWKVRSSGSQQTSNCPIYSEAECELHDECDWDGEECITSCMNIQNQTECGRFSECRWHPYSQGCDDADSIWCEDIINETDCGNHPYGCEWFNGRCDDEGIFDCEDMINETDCNNNSVGCEWFNGRCYADPLSCSDITNQTDCSDSSHDCFWNDGECHEFEDSRSCRYLTTEEDCYRFNCVWWRNGGDGGYCTAD